MHDNQDTSPGLARYFSEVLVDAFLRPVAMVPRVHKRTASAIAQEAVVIKGIQLGAKDYIRKPFHPKDHLDRISRQLNPPVATSG